jgi:hypothetical protein
MSLMTTPHDISTTTTASSIKHHQPDIVCDIRTVESNAITARNNRHFNKYIKQDAADAMSYTSIGRSLNN